jgi:hypothetical protein
MAKFMVIDNGDVVSPANQNGIFESYEAAKGFADAHNIETREYHARFNLKNAYVIAVDGRSPYSSIGSH